MLKNSRVIHKAIKESMAEIETRLMARQDEVVKHNRKLMLDGIANLEKLMDERINEEVTRQIKEQV